MQERNSPMQPIMAESLRRGAVSPLVLSDRLISLARDADRAGFTGTAEQLVTLACAVFDEEPGRTAT